MADIIKVTILEDGTIKSETDPISAPNHQSAEEFLSTVFHLAGQNGTRIPKELGHSHYHSHTHVEQKE